MRSSSPTACCCCATAASPRWAHRKTSTTGHATVSSPAISASPIFSPRRSSPGRCRAAARHRAAKPAPSASAPKASASTIRGPGVSPAKSSAASGTARPCASPSRSTAAATRRCWSRRRAAATFRPRATASSFPTPPRTASLSAIRKARLTRNANLSALLAIVFLPLILYPLLGLVLLSVRTNTGFSFTPYVNFFSNPASLEVIRTTLLIVAASASVATIVGVALAALLFYLPFRGSSTLIRLMELFVAFPSFLVAFTLIFLYGTQGSVNVFLVHAFSLSRPPIDFLFGFGGIVFAQVIYYTPFVVRPTLTALTMIDERVVEAARSLGADPFIVARRVVLPMALPGIVAGSILCFLFIMNEFGILLVLGSAKLITLPLAI